MKTRAVHVLLLIIISGLVGYYIGVSKVQVGWQNYKPQVKISSKEAPSSVKNVDFSEFWEVWEKLEANYYDKTALDPEKMLNGAIMGMVEGLDDPYTVYLPPVQNDSFKPKIVQPLLPVQMQIKELVGLLRKQLKPQ